jgi:hypothetical protein
MTYFFLRNGISNLDTLFYTALRLKIFMGFAPGSGKVYLKILKLNARLKVNSVTGVQLIPNLNLGVKKKTGPNPTKLFTTLNKLTNAF